MFEFPSVKALGVVMHSTHFHLHTERPSDHLLSKLKYV